MNIIGKQIKMGTKRNLSLSSIPQNLGMQAYYSLYVLNLINPASKCKSTIINLLSSWSSIFFFLFFNSYQL